MKCPNCGIDFHSLSKEELDKIAKTWTIQKETVICLCGAEIPCEIKSPSLAEEYKLRRQS